MTLMIEADEGAGNAVFPLLESNKNPELSLYAYDYSSHAVKLVQVFILSPIKLILLKYRCPDTSIISQAPNRHDPQRYMGPLIAIHFTTRH